MQHTCMNDSNLFLIPINSMNQIVGNHGKQNCKNCKFWEQGHWKKKSNQSLGKRESGEKEEQECEVDCIIWQLSKENRNGKLLANI